MSPLGHPILVIVDRSLAGDTPERPCNDAQLIFHMIHLVFNLVQFIDLGGQYRLHPLDAVNCHQWGEARQLMQKGVKYL